jgi:hypothetical protein
MPIMLVAVKVASLGLLLWLASRASAQMPNLCALPGDYPFPFKVIAVLTMAKHQCSLIVRKHASVERVTMAARR